MLSLLDGIVKGKKVVLLEEIDIETLIIKAMSKQICGKIAAMINGCDNKEQAILDAKVAALESLIDIEPYMHAVDPSKENIAALSEGLCALQALALLIKESRKV